MPSAAGRVSAADLCELDHLLYADNADCVRREDFVLTRVNALLASGVGGVWLLPSPEGLDVRLCTPGAEAVPLHKMLEVLSHAGLSALRGREAPWKVGKAVYHVQSVLCALPPVMAGAPDEELLDELELALSRDLAGEGDADALNQLILTAGLTLQEVWLVRAWVAYLQQLDAVFSPAFVQSILLANPKAVLGLVMLFKARLQPLWGGTGKDSREAAESMALGLVDATIAASLSAPVEAVWVALKTIVLATLRTNYWSLPNLGEALAFKVKADDCAVLGRIRPWREIFVHHPTVEGVHLRGGPIARGGLRHSDRPTDYRTEVLGLMVTQMRKNTIIVPVGAKGGFYVRGGTVPDAYKRYVRALISLTDTRVGGKVIHPTGVRVLDGNDPYLVVAADKGTAKFSDVANQEAQTAAYWKGVTNGFWLGDAFASGGSKGYDHKAMGITAKGAWVSVEHHAGLLGIAPSAKRALTVVGIGDMGGDVFGNGLLRSPHVKLLAAFNHAHIFLDPAPDTAISFAERQRCFDAGLGWGGYDVKKISKGGGIWERSVRSIALSEPVQQLLGIKAKSLTPEALIQAILTAPVDVIWNGGIGTYIKATDEPHSAAADKANEPLRVDASSVRARIIGEGGNLGITPRGRVELARRGVRLNTDALDNSAGVDASDHEVNLKILLASAMEDGALNEAGRVKHIKAVAGAMEELILTDNRLQNMALTLEELAPRQTHHELALWQAELLERGVVDVKVDCLPSADVLAARAMERDKALFARPELAALLSGSKATVRAQLLEPEAADILDAPFVKAMLPAYFPSLTQKTFGARIEAHSLAANIVATQLANVLINRLGMVMGPRLRADFHASPLDVIRALVVAMDVLDLPALWAMVDAANLDTPAQAKVLERLRQVAAPVAAWVLRHGQPVNLGAWTGRLAAASHDVVGLLPKVLLPAAKADMKAWVADWQKLGCPAALAQRMSLLSPLVVAPDAIVLAGATKKPLASVLEIHLSVGEALQLPAIIRKLRALPVDDVWTRQALQAMVQELFARQRALTLHLLSAKKAALPPLDRYRALVSEVLTADVPSVAMVSVLVGRLRELEA